MIHANAAMALGLGGGAIVGLALVSAMVANRTRAAAVAVAMAMLALTVLVSCAVAWTSLTTYVGSGGAIWFGIGLVAGLVLGDVAVRIGARRSSGVETGGRRASR